ncbi:MAG TPA: hypothetical protein PKM97_05755 [Bacteroidia bacterium]|nr:hypothetical protein [Bacteroidia bacterium]
MDFDIEKYRQDFEIIRDTAAQVMKDFNMAGFEIKFSGNELIAYDELKEQIIPILSELYNDHSGQFQQLLYRVDIEESKFSELLERHDPITFYSSLADLILQREFQKVLTRKFY